MSHALNPRADVQWRRPWVRSEVGTDFSIILSRLPWEFFGTPTFSGHVPRPGVCQSIFENWKREICEKFGVSQKRLLLALRGEEGEKKGRFHYHYLIGGIFSRNYVSDSKRLAYSWKQVSGGARVDVRVFDRSRSGPEYIAKCLGGANAYEVSKYAFANTVTLSASVLRFVTHMDAVGDRRSGADTRKNGGVTKAAGFTIQNGPGAISLCDETPSRFVGKNEDAWLAPDSRHVVQMNLLDNPSLIPR